MISPSERSFSRKDAWEAYSIVSLGAGVAVNVYLYSIPRADLINAHLIVPPPPFKMEASSSSIPAKPWHWEMVSESPLRGINFSALTMAMPDFSTLPPDHSFNAWRDSIRETCGYAPP